MPVTDVMPKSNLTVGAGAGDVVGRGAGVGPAGRVGDGVAICVGAGDVVGDAGDGPGDSGGRGVAACVAAGGWGKEGILVGVSPGFGIAPGGVETCPPSLPNGSSGGKTRLIA